MAKRFTDTNKWNDPFYLDMPATFKLTYSYILDMCDAVGVWVVNKRLAEFCIGEKINWNEFKKYMGDRLFVINEEKWWLVKFCDFQYGVLSEDTASRPLLSHIKLLKSRHIWKRYLKTREDKIEIDSNNEQKKCDTLQEKPCEKKTIPKIDSKTKSLNSKDIIKKHPIDVQFAFASYFKMRAGIRKKMTENSKIRLINKVEKLSNGDNEIKVKLLNKAEDSNWLSVFPLEKKSVKQQTEESEQERYDELGW